MNDKNRKISPKFWQVTYLLNKAMSKSLRNIARGVLPSGASVTLLDVGCGSMPYRELFEPLVGSYVGCDMYPPSEDIVACPADNLTFEDESFDIVVCFQVLEHVLKPWLVIEECSRVLKPEGILILTAPFVFPFHPSPNDYYRFSHQGLEGLAIHAGLEKVEFEAQCASMTTIFLLLNVMVGQVSHAACHRFMLRPFGWFGLWVVIPLLNLFGLVTETLTPRKRMFKGMQSYSNLIMIARKSLKS